MRSVLLLSSLLAVATTFVVIGELMPEGQAQARENLAHAQEIQSITLEGQRLPMLALRETLHTQIGDKLDNATLEADRVALEASLVGSGYLAAHVDAPIVSFGDGGGAFVTFPIAKGLMFHLRTVTVSGASTRDAGVVTIGKGDDAIADRIERARAGVADRLSTHGKHTVSIRQQVDLAEAAVDVELIAR